MSALPSTSARAPRIAMLSVHTSPLAQPGIGDAGGMNVYITELACALAQLGAQVDIFTRRTAPEQPDCVQLAEGVLVRHITAGPFEGLKKDDLPGQVCYFSQALWRSADRGPDSGAPYDLVHSHYWLSGQAGSLLAERWDIPLVHSMHTMGRVKNAHLAPADKPEPLGRIIGEEQVVAESDALIANTEFEAQELAEYYDADPAKVHVIAPGVDLETFTAHAPDGLSRDQERALLGLRPDEDVIVFAGRIQPLKGPDVLVDALGLLSRRSGEQQIFDDSPAGHSHSRFPTLIVLGGASGRKQALAELKERVTRQGINAHVRFVPPASRADLARWFRVADLVAMPSRSESFGLVALEAQACGTPVVASKAGGLKFAVKHMESGILVPDHRPSSWADALSRLLGDTELRGRLAANARAAAAIFTWQNTAKATLEVYDGAMHEHRAQVNM